MPVDEPQFYEESPCAHGCGRTSIVKHADGRILCRVCYQAEVGMDGPVAGCPTCGSNDLQHRARQTWWALCHMSYTGDQPDLRKQDIDKIASLIRELAEAARAEADDAR